MEKMNELDDLVLLVNSKNNPFDNYSTVKDKTILAIAKAFRELEQRAEAAEAKLAELAKQEPIGRVDRGAATDSNEYPDARVVCLHEHVGWEAFQDGCELFTRPVPAAELVPHKTCDACIHVLAVLGFNYKTARIKDVLSEVKRLRNIEEAQNKTKS